jgi:hypothetical protein
MTLRRDAYWSSVVRLTLVRYRSQTSDIRLCSRIQKTPVLFPTGGRTAIPSGRIHQNLSFAIVSFVWTSWILIVSAQVCDRVIHLTGSYGVPHDIVSCVRFKYCRTETSLTFLHSTETSPTFLQGEAQGQVKRTLWKYQESVCTNVRYRFDKNVS